MLSSQVSRDCTENSSEKTSMLDHTPPLHPGALSTHPLNSPLSLSTGGKQPFTLTSALSSHEKASKGEGHKLLGERLKHS